MKFTLVLVSLISLVLFNLAWPQTASAHLVGQPPFFKINGVYTNLYPVPTTSINDFPLPQDLPNQNYLVNQKLDFTIETAQLSVPPEIVKQSTFNWDFGDGSHGTGLSNSHTYTKMGSYYQTVYVNSPDSAQPIMLQSTLINILPNSNYQLPQAIIYINGKTSKDPLTDVINAPFNQKLPFDATHSTSSSPITSYFWDFGDAQSSTSPTPTHSYDAQVHQYFPLLRIKTADGFIVDNFVEVESDQNQPLASAANSPTPSPSANASSTKKSFNLILVIVAVACLGGVGLFLSKSRRRRR